MDMSDKPKDVLWIFPDGQNVPATGLFEDCKDEISKNGSVSFPVIILDNAGQKIKVSRWKVDVQACIVKYGKDSEKWKGKLLQLILNNKGKLVLEPTEVDIR